MRYNIFFLLLLSMQLHAEENSVSVEGSTIIGNNEQPKALFIVPWQAPSATHALTDPPANLLDTSPQLISRDAIRRKLYYFNASQNLSTQHMNALPE